MTQMKDREKITKNRTELNRKGENKYNNGLE